MGQDKQTKELKMQELYNELQALIDRSESVEQASNVADQVAKLEACAERLLAAFNSDPVNNDTAYDIYSKHVDDFLYDFACGIKEMSKKAYDEIKYRQDCEDEDREFGSYEDQVKSEYYGGR